MEKAPAEENIILRLGPLEHRHNVAFGAAGWGGFTTSFAPPDRL